MELESAEMREDNIGEMTKGILLMQITPFGSEVQSATEATQASDCELLENEVLSF